MITPLLLCARPCAGATELSGEDVPVWKNFKVKILPFISYFLSMFTCQTLVCAPDWVICKDSKCDGRGKLCSDRCLGGCFCRDTEEGWSLPQTKQICCCWIIINLTAGAVWYLSKLASPIVYKLCFLKAQGSTMAWQIGYFPTDEEYLIPFNVCILLGFC